MNWQLNPTLFALLVYALSLGGSFAILYLIYSYQKEWLPFLKKVLKIRGVRWLSFMGFLVSLFLILLQFISGRIDVFVYYLTLPYGLISLLNWLGIEYYPRYLLEYAIPSGSIDLPPIPDDIGPTLMTEKFKKYYQWDYDGRSFSLQLNVREEIYNELKSRSRVELKQWAHEYVTGGIQPEIRELVYKLSKLSEKYYEYQSREEIAFILGFVQSAIQYVQDIVDGEPGEYPKYPIETVVDEKGDCEDVSFLGAALLKSMGYDVALLEYPRHIALGIAGAQTSDEGVVEFNGKQYLYIEMTASGWQIGEIPDNRVNAEVGVYPIPDLKIAN